MASFLSDKFRELLESSDIDWNGSTIKVMALTATASPSASTDEFIDDVSGDEISASAGYSAGGWSLASKTTTTTGNKVVLDAADISEATATFTNAAAYFVIYKDTGTPATSPILAVIDSSGATKQPSSQPFTITFSGDGVIRV